MKDIKGYEGLYAITSCGRVWSYRSKRFLKNSLRKDGYYIATLKVNQKGKSFLIHRLVAEAYLSNPDNLSQVDHIDRDKSHNYINNLHWVSATENQLNTSKARGPVRCIETGIVYRSASEAARMMGLDRGNVNKACDRPTRGVYGYHFERVIILEKKMSDSNS